jgi:hypothetical protein
MATFREACEHSKTMRWPRRWFEQRRLAKLMPRTFAAWKRGELMYTGEDGDGASQVLD